MKPVNIFQSVFQGTLALQDINRCYIIKRVGVNKENYLLQNFSVFNKLNCHVNVQDVFNKSIPRNSWALELFLFSLELILQRH